MYRFLLNSFFQKINKIYFLKIHGGIVANQLSQTRKILFKDLT